MIHSGGCFCSAVRLEITGVPEAIGYRHGQSRRLWSAASVKAFTLGKRLAVRIGAGTEPIATFQKRELSRRQPKLRDFSAELDGSGETMWE